LNDRDCGLGLAAALLGELTLEGKIVVQDGILLVLPASRVPPWDALAHVVLDEIMREPIPHDLRDWLTAFGQTAHERVAERLRRAGHVRRARVHRLFRADELRFVPVSINTAASPWARLAVRLGREQALTVQDVFLAGIASATGLAGRILADAPRSARSYLSQCVAALPAPLHELSTQTQVLVGEAVLSHRR
jgi:hypothetical protein